MIKNLKNMFYLSAYFLLIFLTSIIVITGLMFLFHISISYLQIITSFICSVAYLIFFIGKKYRLKEKIFAIIISIILVLTSAFICSKYFDISWDGNTYHKDAIGALKNGWNPVYDNYIDFYETSSIRDMNYIGDELVVTHGFWQTYYAKGAWYVDANFYYIFNNIESSKLFNILLAYISFIFSIYFVNKITKKLSLSIVVGFIFAFSPVVIVQLFNNYNDGALYNGLLCLVLSFLLFCLNFERKQMISWIFCLIIICCNIKFTGFVYAGFFCLALYIIYVLENRKKIKEIIKPTIVFSFSLLIAIFIAGFSPYITNIMSKGNMFYPLLGKDKVDIITYNQPKEFVGESTIVKFSKSIFSKTANINEKSNNKLQLKLPLTVYSDELQVLNKNDLRIGGFGVYFSAIFLFSLIIILYGLIINYKNKNYLFKYYLAIFMTTIFLILILSESWWARYTPFVYFLPLMALTMMFTTFKNKKYANIALICLSFVMFINLSFFINNNLFYNYKEAKNYREILEKYQNSSEYITIVDVNNSFLGALYNFDDYNIKYNISLDSSNQDKTLFRYLKYRKN